MILMNCLELEMTLETLKQQLLPYRGVIRFAVVLVVAHFLWKFTIVGDECGGEVTLFGCDITAPFDFMCAHIAQTVYAILLFFGYDVTLSDTFLRFANGNSVGIIWACSGLKQMFIFACILITARGPWRHKLWFVPMGVVACHVVNVLRITLLSVIVCHRPEWFDLMHEHITKYLFYAIIFLFWVWWEERFNKGKEGE